MRSITTISLLALAAAPVFAQVSGIDTTQSLEDRAAFPDPTLPQENTYIPETRKKVSTPLDELLGKDEEEEGPTAEEVADFIGIEAPAEDAPATESAETTE